MRVGVRIRMKVRVRVRVGVRISELDHALVREGVHAVPG